MANLDVTLKPTNLKVVNLDLLEAKSKTDEETKFLDDYINSDNSPGFVKDLFKVNPEGARQVVRGLSNLQLLSTLDHTPPLFKDYMSGAGVASYTDTGDWGKSVYDDDIMFGGYDKDLVSDLRAGRQSGLTLLFSGVAKGAITAGTTALGDIGLLYGLGSALVNLDISKIWDNEVNQALASVQAWSEEFFPNYRSAEALRDVWTFSGNWANFIGDTIIKNMGFMVGAYYAGLPVSKLGQLHTASALKNAIEATKESSKEIAVLTKKALDTGQKLSKEARALMVEQSNIRNAIVTRNRLGWNLASSFISAVNEGSIEAVHNSKDWMEAQVQLENQQYRQERMKVMQEYADDPEGLIVALSLVDQEHENRLKAIEVERVNMGNADLLMNIPVLTASNLIMFGKQWGQGFKHQRQMFNTIKTTTKKLANQAEEVLEFKNTMTTAKNFAKAMIKPMSEGLEEYLQNAANTGAGNAAREALERYVNTSEDYVSTNTVFNSMIKSALAIVQNVTNPNAVFEFFVGYVSALLGTPTFGKVLNKGAWTGQHMFGLNGGLVGEFMDLQALKQQADKIAAELTKRYNNADFDKMLKNIVKHKSLDYLISEALASGDKKIFKDLELEQLYTDLQLFSAAGKLDLFKQRIKDINPEAFTDEEIDELINSTTTEITAEQLEELDRAELATIEQLLKVLVLEKSRAQKKFDEDEESRNKIKELTEQLPKGVSQPAEADMVSVSPTYSHLRLTEREIQDLELRAKVLSDRLEAHRAYKENGTGEAIYVSSKEGMYIRGGVRMSNDEVRALIRDHKDQIEQGIKDFLNARDEVDFETNGTLNDALLGYLTLLKTKILNAEQRTGIMSEELKPVLKVISDTLAELIQEADKKVRELENTEYVDELEKHKADLTKALNVLEHFRNVQEVVDLLVSSEGSLGFEGLAANPIILREIINLLYSPLYLFDKEDTRADVKFDYKSSKGREKLKTYFLEQRMRSTTMKEAALKLLDLVRLGSDKLSYQTQLAQYIQNPEDLDTTIMDIKGRINLERKEERLQYIVPLILKAKDYRELTDVLRSIGNDVTVLEALERAESLANPDTKNFLQQYRRIEKIYSGIKGKVQDIIGERSTYLNDENLYDSIVQGVEKLLSLSFDAVMSDGTALDKGNAFLARLKETALEYKNLAEAMVSGTDTSWESTAPGKISKLLSELVTDYKNTVAMNSQTNPNPGVSLNPSNPTPPSNNPPVGGNGGVNGGNANQFSSRQEAEAAISAELESISEDDILDIYSVKKENLPSNPVFSRLLAIADRWNGWANQEEKIDAIIQLIHDKESTAARQEDNIDSNDDPLKANELSELRATNSTISNLPVSNIDITTGEQFVPTLPLDVVQAMLSEVQNDDAINTILDNIKNQIASKTSYFDEKGGVTVDQLINSIDADTWSKLSKETQDKVRGALAEALEMRALQNLFNEYGTYNLLDHNIFGQIYQNDNGVVLHYVKLDRQTDENGNALNQSVQDAVFIAIDAEKIPEGVSKRWYKTIKGQDGKTEYIIVGALHTSANATQAAVKEKEEIVKLVNQAYSLQEKNQTQENRLFVSTQEGRILKINTGRLYETHKGEKQSVDDWLKEMGLDDNTLSQYLDNNLCIVVSGRMDQFAPGERGDNWVDLNNPQSHNGQIFLYVMRPDGQYYPILLTRATITDWWGEVNEISDIPSFTGKDSNVREALRLAVLDVLGGLQISHNDFLATLVSFINEASEFDPTASEEENRRRASQVFRFCDLILCPDERGKDSIRYNYSKGLEVKVNGNWVNISDQAARSLGMTSKEDILLWQMQQIFSGLSFNSSLPGAYAARFTLPSANNRKYFTLNLLSAIRAGVLKVGLLGFYNVNSNFIIKSSQDSSLQPLLSHGTVVKGAHLINLPGKPGELDRIWFDLNEGAISHIECDSETDINKIARKFGFDSVDELSLILLLNAGILDSPLVQGADISLNRTLSIPYNGTYIHLKNLKGSTVNGKPLYCLNINGKFIFYGTLKNGTIGKFSQENQEKIMRKLYEQQIKNLKKQDPLAYLDLPISLDTYIGGTVEMKSDDNSDWIECTITFVDTDIVKVTDKKNGKEYVLGTRAVSSGKLRNPLKPDSLLFDGKGTIGQRALMNDGTVGVIEAVSIQNGNMILHIQHKDSSKVVLADQVKEIKPFIDTQDMVPVGERSLIEDLDLLMNHILMIDGVIYLILAVNQESIAINPLVVPGAPVWIGKEALNLNQVLVYKLPLGFQEQTLEKNLFKLGTRVMHIASNRTGYVYAYSNDRDQLNYVIVYDDDQTLEVFPPWLSKDGKNLFLTSIEPIKPAVAATLLEDLNSAMFLGTNLDPSEGKVVIGEALKEYLSQFRKGNMIFQVTENDLKNKLFREALELFRELLVKVKPDDPRIIKVFQDNLAHRKFSKLLKEMKELETLACK